MGSLRSTSSRCSINQLEAPSRFEPVAMQARTQACRENPMACNCSTIVSSATGSDVAASLVPSTKMNKNRLKLLLMVLKSSVSNLDRYKFKFQNQFPDLPAMSSSPGWMPPEARRSDRFNLHSGRGHPSSVELGSNWMATFSFFGTQFSVRANLSIWTQRISGNVAKREERRAVVRCPGGTVAGEMKSRIISCAAQLVIHA